MTWTDLQTALGREGYVASEDLAVALHLSLTLGRPLLLEGAAGVGKTEVARTLAAAQETRLIRLQCYEGLDAAQAIYEWNYQRQLLSIRAAAEDGETGKSVEARIFSRDFLLERPLLAAITQDTPPVLLIDEIDRADEEFEAYLLEILSDFQVSIPELGTITAERPPLVVLTSNRTRDVHDALKRRCLYHWVEHPDFDREVEIVKLRAPGVGDPLARQVAAATEAMRGFGLYKPPGVAESIDWALSLAALGREDIDETSVEATLGTVLKYREDQQRVIEKGIPEMVRNAVLRGGA